MNRVTQNVTFLYGGEWLSAEEVTRKEKERIDTEAEEARREAELREERIEAQRRAIQGQMEVERKAQEEAQRRQAEAEQKAKAEETKLRESQDREERIEAQKRAILAQMEADRLAKADEQTRLEAQAREERIEAQRRALEAQMEAERKEREAKEAERERLAPAKAEELRKEAISKITLEITGSLVTRYKALNEVSVNTHVPCVLHNGSGFKIRRVGFSLVFKGTRGVRSQKEYHQADLVFSRYSAEGLPGPGQRVKCSIAQPNVPEDADKLQYDVVINSVEFEKQ